MIDGHIFRLAIVFLSKNNMLICDIENIKIISKNQKYIKNKYTGNLILSSVYKNFKKELFFNFKKTKIESPYEVKIELWTYLDIDAAVQAVLDTLEDKMIIDNDRNILKLEVKKNKIKRGLPGRIRIECLTL